RPPRRQGGPRRPRHPRRRHRPRRHLTLLELGPTRCGSRTRSDPVRLVVVREDQGVRAVAFLLVTGLFAGVGWAIDRGVAATRRADDMSYSARLARTQSKGLGFVTVLSLLLAVVVGL